MEKLAALTEQFSEDLCGYAAREAAIVLIDNWKDAMRDGAVLRKLAYDVNDVVALLRKFQDDVSRLDT